MSVFVMRYVCVCVCTQRGPFSVLLDACSEANHSEKASHG